MGALDEDDLCVLGRTVLAEERLERLLERAAEQLDPQWEDEVAADWETRGGDPIQYVVFDPPGDSWLAARRDGALYLLVAGGTWNGDGPIGNPTVYAGVGWTAKREERATVTGSDWQAHLAAAGFGVRPT